MFTLLLFSGALFFLIGIPFTLITNVGDMGCVFVVCFVAVFAFFLTGVFISSTAGAILALIVLVLGLTFVYAAGQ